MRLVVLMVVLAGCAGSVPEPVQDEPILELLLPESYALVCPPGGSDVGGVCAYRITSLTETNQEPFVAVHPTDAGIVAVGVNAGHTIEGMSPHGEEPGFDMVRLDIFITSDGGASWRRSTLPYVADPAVTFGPQTSVIGDPALEFDRNGTLHVSGIASHSQARGYNVFYTQSTDLGQTWKQPVVLSTGDDNDRNWLNLGPDGTVYVPWQRVGSLSEVAWSPDGGATWQRQERSQVADGCITISEMAFFRGEALFACSRTQGGYQVVVYAFDPATGAIEERARPDFPCIWPKLNAAGDLLFLSAEGCPGNRYATSSDAVSWSAPRDLAELAPGAVMWQTDDPWGRIHLLLADGASKAYIVVDPASGTVLQQTALPSEPAVPAVPQTIAPAYGDHYWGIDVQSHTGALVWTRQDNLDLSFLEPVLPAV